MDDPCSKREIVTNQPNSQFRAPILSSSTPLYIVFNATSGSGDKQESLATIRDVLDQAQRPYEIFSAKEAGQIATFAQAAVKQAQMHQGAVVACGGDGTINAVVAEVLPTGLPMGLIPQGTFNYTGRTHSIPLTCIEATQALLTARIRPIQVGKVNDRVFLVNASLGLYPQLLEDRETFKHQYGRKRIVAFVGGLITLLRYRGQLHLEIEHDGKVERIRTPTVFVGNNRLQLEQVGLPEADDVRQRRLAALIVRPVGMLGMLALAFNGAAGRLHEAKNVRDFPFAAMTVRSAGRFQSQVKIATDGEVCWMRPPLRFHVATQKLMLMAPAEGHA
jgi:diacylglycerol kinase family enzyme